MPNLTEQAASAYTSQSRRNVERLRVVVACCTDGRLQEVDDEFLQNHQGLRLTAQVRTHWAEVRASQ